MKKEIFRVTGMTCAACARHVKNAAEAVDGVLECSVALLQNKMRVTYDDTVTTAKQIAEKDTEIEKLKDESKKLGFTMSLYLLKDTIYLSFHT